MHVIEVNEIQKVMQEAGKVPGLHVMFVADTGVGKTTAVKQYCKDNNIFLVTKVLSTLDPSESLGIPVQSTMEYNGKQIPVLKNAVPDWVVELAQHERAILYLDEFLCADPEVVKSFLNFLTEMQVDQFDLRHVQVVAATNISNYTFDPDTNLMSRFCFFYVENTSYKDYVEKKVGKRLPFDYQDEEPRDSVLFDQRSLKPRCYEQLCNIQDPKFLAMFYEGFTNSKMPTMYHNDQNVNSAVAPLVKLDANGKEYLDDQALNTLAGMLAKMFPRYRKFDKIMNGFDQNTIHVDVDKLNALISQIKSNK